MNHFEYTEKFNDKTLVHLEWDSEVEADFYNMHFSFERIVKALRKENIAVDTIGSTINGVCGYCANCGPSKGDTLTKVLRMTRV